MRTFLKFARFFHCPMNYKAGKYQKKGFDGIEGKNKFGTITAAYCHYYGW